MDLGARPSGRILAMLIVKSEEKQSTSRDVSQNLIYLHDNDKVIKCQYEIKTTYNNHTLTFAEAVLSCFKTPAFNSRNI